MWEEIAPSHVTTSHTYTAMPVILGRPLGVKKSISGAWSTAFSFLTAGETTFVTGVLTSKKSSTWINGRAQATGTEPKVQMAATAKNRSIIIVMVVTASGLLLVDVGRFDSTTACAWSNCVTVGRQAGLVTRAF